MKRILREPLLHFFVLGGALFGLYALLDRGATHSPEEIIVGRDRVAALVAQHRRTWQRVPTPDELHALVDGWVREEVLYREGIAVGMDRDDAVIRRRVAQKMEVLADDLGRDTPTDAELQAWLVRHADDYRIEAGYTLRQVYLDPQLHTADLDAVLARTLQRLRTRSDTVVGDASLLPGILNDTRERDVARIFGSDFTTALRNLPVGEWYGPVSSGYGLHFVRIDAREPGRVPSLAEVRPEVERDLLGARARDSQERFYSALRQRYTVAIEADLDAFANSTTDPANGPMRFAKSRQ